MTPKVNMTQEEVDDVAAGKCPDCGKSITRTDQECCSINFICFHCGARFNISDRDLYPGEWKDWWRMVKEYGRVDLDKGYIRERVVKLSEKVVKVMREAIERKVKK